MTSRSMGILFNHYLYMDYLELDMKEGTTKVSKLNLKDVLKISEKTSLKIILLPLKVWN